MQNGDARKQKTYALTQRGDYIGAVVVAKALGRREMPVGSAIQTDSSCGEPG
jgi:hypothetical protein